MIFLDIYLKDGKYITKSKQKINAIKGKNTK